MSCSNVAHQRLSLCIRSSSTLLLPRRPNAKPLVQLTHVSLVKLPPQVKAGTPTMHCNPNAGAILSAFLEGVCDGKTLPLTRLLPRCMTCMGSGTPLNLNDPTCHTSICNCSTQQSVRHKLGEWSCISTAKTASIAEDMHCQAFCSSRWHTGWSMCQEAGCKTASWGENEGCC